LTFDRNHIKSIQKTVDALNERFDFNSTLDFFKVASYDGQRLVIWGSSDFTTHHSLELIFEKVLFFKGDFEWSRNDEKELITAEDITTDPVNFKMKFMLESDGYYFSNSNHKIEIHAQDFLYDTSVVLYFYKDVLAPGEKVAPWVKRNS